MIVVRLRAGSTSPSSCMPGLKIEVRQGALLLAGDQRDSGLVGRPFYMRSRALIIHSKSKFPALFRRGVFSSSRKEIIHLDRNGSQPHALKAGPIVSSRRLSFPEEEGPAISTTLHLVAALGDHGGYLRYVHLVQRLRHQDNLAHTPAGNGVVQGADAALYPGRFKPVLHIGGMQPAAWDIPAWG